MKTGTHARPLSLAALALCLSALACQQPMIGVRASTAHPGEGPKIVVEAAGIDFHGHAVATFTATEEDVPLTLADVTALAPRFTLAKLTDHPADGQRAWESLLPTGARIAPILRPGGPDDPQVLTSVQQPGAETPAAMVDLGEGRFRYVYAHAVTGFNPDETIRVGVWLDAVESASLRTSTTFDFRPDSGPVEARDAVLDKNCETCHGHAVLGHERRAGVRLCLTCHTWQAVESAHGRSRGARDDRGHREDEPEPARARAARPPDPPREGPADPLPDGVGRGLPDHRPVPDRPPRALHAAEAGVGGAQPAPGPEVQRDPGGRARDGLRAGGEPRPDGPVPLEREHAAPAGGRTVPAGPARLRRLPRRRAAGLPREVRDLPAHLLRLPPGGLVPGVVARVGPRPLPAPGRPAARRRVVPRLPRDGHAEALRAPRRRPPPPGEGGSLQQAVPPESSTWTTSSPGSSRR